MTMYPPENSPKLAGSKYQHQLLHTLQSTIHSKILQIAFVILTFFCMSGLAPAARRSSTTLWWLLKLAVHSGVRPSYSECVSVYCRTARVCRFLSDVSQHMLNMKNSANTTIQTLYYAVG